ncbi:DEAD/DEAH box helicase, partial [Streptomyces fulvissimus]|nr:DEAD/DEAH box helicase [Streptomyces microflavus]
MTVPAAGRGTTTVAPRAVRRIAERAAAEALPDGGSV